jgi:hypothetical protein
MPKLFPGFAYPGAKVRLGRQLAAMLPPEGKRFVDLFAGRGNVTWAVMSLLRYEEFWLNDIQSFPFLDGLKHSRIYATPEWRYRSEVRGPDMFVRMKNRNEGGLRPVGKDWQEVWYVAYTAAYTAALQEGKSKKKAKKKAESLGWIAANRGTGTRHPRRYPPAPLLEGYLTYSGGTYTGVGKRGKTGGGVTREGFAINVRRARELIEEHQPLITRLDYREVLKQCDPDDVVLRPVYRGRCPGLR